jgi:hypothetical protein
MREPAGLGAYLLSIVAVVAAAGVLLAVFAAEPAPCHRGGSDGSSLLGPAFLLILGSLALLVVALILGRAIRRGPLIGLGCIGQLAVGVFFALAVLGDTARCFPT